MLANRLIRSAFGAGLLLSVMCVYTSELSAQSWAPQLAGEGVHYSAVSFIDDFTGYASGSYGVVVKTTNGGATWNPLSTGSGYSFSDQFFLDAQTGWVVGEAGVILKTTDGGATWSEQQSGTSVRLNAVQFYNALVGIAAGDGGVVVKTTDGGAAWVAVQTGVASTIQGVCFSSASMYWLAAESGAVVKSTNGGSSWQSTVVSASSGLHDVEFVDMMTGWAVGANGAISKTTDGGASWFAQFSGTQNALNMIVAVSAARGWAVGDGGTILATSDGGATWSPQASATTENLRAAFFLDEFHGYAVGLNSTILEYAVVHALPVQLSRFVATAVSQSSVRLEWTTVSELNNYGFYVQRSADAASGYVRLQNSFQAGHGTSNNPHDYSYTDNTITPGRWYYRLEQIDLDGTTSFSDPISVDILTGVEETQPTAFALRQNYPNPFNPSTLIEFSIPEAGNVTLRIFDLAGREVAALVNEEMQAGSYARSFSAEGLSSGTYIYRLTAGQFTSTRKLVLMK